MLPPLFPGIPGGPELLVMLLIMLLLFGLPLVLVAAGVIAWRRTSGAGDDRVEELESRVDELERETEGKRRGRDGRESDDRRD